MENRRAHFTAPAVSPEISWRDDSMNSTNSSKLQDSARDSSSPANGQRSRSLTAQYLLLETAAGSANTSKFTSILPIVVSDTHGGGQPPRGVRRLLHRLHNEHKDINV